MSWGIVYSLISFFGYNLSEKFILFYLLMNIVLIFVRIIFNKYYSSHSKFFNKEIKLSSIDNLLRLFLLFFPIYFISIVESYGVTISSFIQNPIYALSILRQDSVIGSQYGASFSLLNNIPIVINFLFIYTIINNNRKQIYFASFLNIVYSSALGSKMGLVSTLIILFIYNLNTSRGVKIKTLLLPVFAFCLFVASVLIINFGTVEKFFLEDFLIAIKSYFIGGPLSFNYLIENGFFHENSQQIWRPLIEILRSIGFNIEITSRHLDYVVVGDFTTNVYTFLISFFNEFGFLGSLFFTIIYFSIGEFITSIGFKNSRFLRLISPSVLLAAIFTIHAEQLLSGLSLYIKFFILYILFVKLNFNGNKNLSYYRR